MLWLWVSYIILYDIEMNRDRSLVHVF